MAPLYPRKEIANTSIATIVTKLITRRFLEATFREAAIKINKSLVSIIKLLFVASPAPKMIKNWINQIPRNHCRTCTSLGGFAPEPFFDFPRHMPPPLTVTFRNSFELDWRFLLRSYPRLSSPCVWRVRTKLIQQSSGKIQSKRRYLKTCSGREGRWFQQEWLLCPSRWPRDLPQSP